LGNALPRVLAEFIIASTIDTLDSPREEWSTYDLETKNVINFFPYQQKQN
jgi:hypothetical protein